MSFCIICCDNIYNHSINEIIYCDNIFNNINNKCKDKYNLIYCQEITKIKEIKKKTKDKSVKMFKCSVCGKEIKNKQNYDSHVKNKICEREATEFKCNICGRPFQEKRSLIYHYDHKVCEKKNIKYHVITNNNDKINNDYDYCDNTINDDTIKNNEIINEEINSEINNKIINITNDNKNNNCIGKKTINGLIADKVKQFKTLLSNEINQLLISELKPQLENYYGNNFSAENNTNNINQNNTDQNNTDQNNTDQNNTNQNNTKKKKRKIKISVPLKRKVWQRWVGIDIGKTKCLCCDITDIEQINFCCGHVIAESQGGSLNINNLRPICTSCNSSMGRMNMFQFMRENNFIIKPAILS